MDLARLDALVAEKYGLAPKLYTSDPVAAKELRHELNIAGFSWTLEHAHGNPFVLAECWKDADVYEARHSTEELATVLCALKAVGVDTDKLR